jgi:hypothetical protein
LAYDNRDFKVAAAPAEYRQRASWIDGVALIDPDQRAAKWIERHVVTPIAVVRWGITCYPETCFSIARRTTDTPT